MMNLTKTVILTSLLALLSNCKNQEPQQENNVNSDVAMIPEKTYINVSEKADYLDDLNKSINTGDLRFVGLMGFALIVPGVPDYHERYKNSNGVKIIEGTSDSYDLLDDPKAMEKVEFYKNYAREYNLLLLEYLDKQR
jgi:hypothetical protein